MKRMVSRVSGRGIRVACAVAGLSALCAGSALAQSTIFNIPSTDTVAAKKGYFEFDWLPQATVEDGASRIFIYNPRLVVGLGHDMEVGVNFPILHSSDFDPSSLAYIQPNFKWKFFNNDGAGVAASAGVVVNTPLNSRDGQGTWSYIYGNISKKWMGKGPRVTFGPYGVLADQDSEDVTFAGTKGGVLLGYEQPLGGPVSFVADWFSGSNTIGYFTPGISIALPHSGLLNIAFISLGNDSWENSNETKNRYWFIYYGVTF